eukprot:gene2924-3210_t
MMLDPRPLSVKRLLKYAARDIHHVISRSAMAELELKEAMFFHRQGRDVVVKEADEFGLGAYEVLGPQAMVLSARCGSTDASGNSLADRVTNINHRLVLDAPAPERSAVAAELLEQKVARALCGGGRGHGAP